MHSLDFEDYTIIAYTGNQFHTFSYTPVDDRSHKPFPTVDGRNPAPPGCMKPCKTGINKLSINILSTGAGFLPSTVVKSRDSCREHILHVLATELRPVSPHTSLAFCPDTNGLSCRSF